MLYPNELAALARLQSNKDFANLSIAALLYEAICCSSVRDVDTIFKAMKASIEADTVDEKLKAFYLRSQITNVAS